MPWRGPETPGEFPTLGYVVADFIEAFCAIPDGDQAGQPFLLPEEQLRFLLWHYRLRPDAVAGMKPSQAFVYRRSQLVRPQKWGKGPFLSAIICAEAAGPVLFDGWDANGDPVGRPWATPWIQVVAVSEDQTANIWTALVPMIELGDLAADVPDTGKTRINIAGDHGSRGLIEPVTSAALSRLGQRITFGAHDETHSWTAQNGGRKLADTQRRNLAGMGGRSIETTNAWDPAEESVAQTTHEAQLDDVYVDFPPTPPGSIRNKAERRKALRAVYRGAPWVDLDRIDAEILELLPRDPAQAERFYLNRIVAGADKAWDVEAYRRLSIGGGIAPGRVVTLGFDGAKRQDSTALIVTDVDTGWQAAVGVWERPADLPADDDEWEVDAAAVTEAVRWAHETWDVWRGYYDPPYWRTEIDEWAGEFGDKVVVRFDTQATKRMALCLRAYTEDLNLNPPEDALPRAQAVTHGPLDDSPEAEQAHAALVRHHGNAVKRSTRIRDESGGWLWTISKPSPKSRDKIDAAMAAALSWEARSDALRAGANRRSRHRRASWA